MELNKSGDVVRNRIIFSRFKMVVKREFIEIDSIPYLISTIWIYGPGYKCELKMKTFAPCFPCPYMIHLFCLFNVSCFWFFFSEPFSSLSEFLPLAFATTVSRLVGLWNSQLKENWFRERIVCMIKEKEDENEQISKLRYISVQPINCEVFAERN